VIINLSAAPHQNIILITDFLEMT